MAKSTTKKWAIGAAAAAAAGYVAGILTAPKSGKKTRADIQEKAKNTKLEAEKNLKTLHNELDNLIKQSKEKLNGATKTVQEGFTESLKGAEQAKNKAQNVLKVLKAGNVDVKELQKAIKDVNKAASHLKKFVGTQSKNIKKAIN